MNIQFSAGAEADVWGGNATAPVEAAPLAASAAAAPITAAVNSSGAGVGQLPDHREPSDEVDGEEVQGSEKESEDYAQARAALADPPQDFVKASALVQLIDALPVKSPAQDQAKKNMRHAAGQHLLQLQQGPAAPVMHADNLIAQVNAHAEVSKNAHWEFFARTHPTAREMLTTLESFRKGAVSTEDAQRMVNEIERLQGVAAARNTEVNDAKLLAGVLQTERDALKVENDRLKAELAALKKNQRR